MSNTKSIEQARLVDTDEIQRALRLLVEPGQVVEVRALGATTRDYSVPRPISGYFDDMEKLTCSLKDIVSAKGIYLTINPCQRALLARANNRLRLRGDKEMATTNNKQITARRWIPIDCDPIREGGITDISATDAEHQAALDKAQTIHAWLTSQGWHGLVLVDSGNGAYVLVPIDVPAEDDDLAQRVLKAIAAKFNDERVHVDLTMYNQARIVRLPGTWNCKGDSTDDRPHRIARVTHETTRDETVSREQLEAVAGPRDEPTTKKTEPQKYKQSHAGTSSSSFTMQDFIDKHGIATERAASYNGGTKWLLPECPFCGNADHCAILVQRASGELCFSCSHNSCQGYEWQDFRVRYEPDAYTRKQSTAYRKTSSSHQGNGYQPPPSVAHEAALLCAFSADDAGNGDALFALYEHEFLYCHERGWMYYDGTCWREDFSECRIRQAATDTLRKRQHAAIDQRKDDVLKCAKPDTSRVTGAIVRFKSLVGIGIDAFDNNPHVLNCANGVLDLRTLTLSAHDRQAYRFTYCLTVNFDTSVDLLEWQTFLHATLGDDEEKIEYLQRAVGYSLTGLTREEVLFYLFGPPRAGKGTLSETLMALLGNLLSASVDFNTFTAKREGDTSNFDLAPLKPARMVFASESNRSQSLNPAKIKSCTGGDITRCCYKHKDHFQYRPQYKVWMLSNHPVNGDPEDDALWGRVRVIEFPNSHLGSEDKELKERLKSDEVQQSVLLWAALGAQAWYQHGLTTPQSVLDITRKQRNELDYVQQWLDECQDTESDGWTANEVVMSNYLAWCNTNNVTKPKGPKSLAQSLQAKGYETGCQRKEDGKNKKGVNGLRLLSL